MKISSYTKSQARRDLPRRSTSDNKTRGGKCLIIAGSKNMPGAAILCARAAARMGAGYVHLFKLNLPLLAQSEPDFLWQSKLTASDLRRFQAVALGPGCESQAQLRRLIRLLLKTQFVNVVLDAEALNVLASLKLRLPSTWILTPHEGELARLLDVDAELIRRDRAFYARLAHQKFGATVLLKGHGTLIAASTRLYKVSTGTPALAKAGTGDVLTGMITALLAQGLNAEKAACLGAYIHGMISQRWEIERNDVLSLMARDLIERLPGDLRRLRSGSSARPNNG